MIGLKQYPMKNLEYIIKCYAYHDEAVAQRDFDMEMK